MTDEIRNEDRREPDVPEWQPRPRKDPRLLVIDEDGEMHLVGRREPSREPTPHELDERLRKVEQYIATMEATSRELLKSLNEIPKESQPFLDLGISEYAERVLRESVTRRTRESRTEPPTP